MWFLGLRRPCSGPECLVQGGGLGPEAPPPPASQGDLPSWRPPGPAGTPRFSCPAGLPTTPSPSAVSACPGHACLGLGPLPAMFAATAAAGDQGPGGQPPASHSQRGRPLTRQQNQRGPTAQAEGGLRGRNGTCAQAGTRACRLSSRAGLTPGAPGGCSGHRTTAPSPQRRHSREEPRPGAPPPPPPRGSRATGLLTGKVLQAALGAGRAGQEPDARPVSHRTGLAAARDHSPRWTAGREGPRRHSSRARGAARREAPPGPPPLSLPCASAPGLRRRTCCAASYLNCEIKAEISSHKPAQVPVIVA